MNATLRISREIYLIAQQIYTEYLSFVNYKLQLFVKANAESIRRIINSRLVLPYAIGNTQMLAIWQYRDLATYSCWQMNFPEPIGLFLHFCRLFSY
jgi:hypothetical protein